MSLIAELFWYSLSECIIWWIFAYVAKSRCRKIFVYVWYDIQVENPFQIFWFLCKFISTRLNLWYALHMKLKHCRKSFKYQSIKSYLSYSTTEWINFQFLSKNKIFSLQVNMRKGIHTTFLEKTLKLLHRIQFIYIT